MKEEYRDFVGIFDESVPLELCNEFIDNYETAHKNRTFIDLSKENELGFIDNESDIARTDTSVYVTPTVSSVYPKPPVEAYWQYLRVCYMNYIKRYHIEFKGPVFNDVFKVHKVKKTEGFHIWHYERSQPSNTERIMAYMTYLEVPSKGGETEFLHQSLRVDPVVGRTLIWPAGFTHMHRGNPPLEGEKMYITGWFTSPRVDLSD
tara:strand:+ start:600 stop:1214 length:615 start_codon:yes stop_codon:yes gene_type:complete